MIPPFKYYFYPFLKSLEGKESCRLSDISSFIAKHLKLSQGDIYEYTKGGTITKHRSRIYYCASYLKKMKLVISDSSRNYILSDKGKIVLSKYGKDLTLTHLRELPEFALTQIKENNSEVIYVKPHMRGKKFIAGYYCNKKYLSNKNPNIQYVNYE